VRELLTANGMAPERAGSLVKTLNCDKWTHDFPIGVVAARSLGLAISEEMLNDVLELMALYRSPSDRPPSVEYVPVPYDGPGMLPGPSRRPSCALCLFADISNSTRLIDGPACRKSGVAARTVVTSAVRRLRTRHWAC
jgi:hypothetical protein